LVEYTNNAFSITVEEAKGILTRAYVKKFNGKSKIRLECPEYPQSSLMKIIKDRVYCD
jgi:hypothetical protein